MRSLQVPASFKEVLGHTQRPWQLAAVFAVGTLVAILLTLEGREVWEPLPWWRRLLAFLLVLDIVAGCLANFTRGTNDFYAASARRRRVFLAVHVHVLLLAWALKQDLAPAAAVWAYTLAGACGVDAVRERDSQLFAAGTWLALGLAWIVVMVPAPPALLAVYLLFLFKLVFSFAVDHHGTRAPGARRP